VPKTSWGLRARSIGSARTVWFVRLTKILSHLPNPARSSATASLAFALGDRKVRASMGESARYAHDVHPPGVQTRLQFSSNKPSGDANDPEIGVERNIAKTAE
jgi:hypothetical protein